MKFTVLKHKPSNDIWWALLYLPWSNSRNRSAWEMKGIMQLWNKPNNHPVFPPLWITRLSSWSCVNLKKQAPLFFIMFHWFRHLSSLLFWKLSCCAVRPSLLLGDLHHNAILFWGFLLFYWKHLLQDQAVQSLRRALLWFGPINNLHLLLSAFESQNKGCSDFVDLLTKL